MTPVTGRGWRLARRLVLPRAVNPDRALRKVAQQRGWPVLSFSAPGGAQAGGPAASRGL